MMITITKPALKHIQSLLHEKGDHTAFRLAVKETGCSGYMYVPEIVEKKKKETDIPVPNDDILIYIDADSADIIKNTTIDYVKKSFGFEQLVFHNPNAEGLCGCGESFKLKKPT